MLDKTLLITFPIRDRADILVKYNILGHISKQDYPKNLIGLYFIIHEKQTDNTEKIIREFQEKHKSEYKEITVDNVKLGTPSDKRTSSWRRIIRKSLYKLYDKCLTYSTSKNYDYCLLMGSDTQLTSPNLLSSIISRNKDFIAPLMYDGGSNRIWNVWNYIRDGHYDWSGLRTGNIGPGVIEVDALTGIFMISDRLLKEGVRYSTRQKEDFGYCEEAKEMCGSIFVDTDVYSNHQPALKERK